jgi:hypothetical protein
MRGCRSGRRTTIWDVRVPLTLLVFPQAVPGGTCRKDFSEPVSKTQRLCSEVIAAMMRSCNCQGGRFTARGTARRRKEAARWMQRHRHRGPTPTC